MRALLVLIFFLAPVVHAQTDSETPPPKKTKIDIPAKPLPLSSRKRVPQKKAAVKKAAPKSEDAANTAPARASEPEVAPKTEVLEPLRKNEPIVPPLENSEVQRAPPSPPPREEDLPPDQPADASGPRPARFNAAITATLLSIPVPLKYGVSLSYIRSPQWRYELTYFTGAYEIDNRFISLGGFKEALITLNARRFIGRSFNFVLGLSTQKYTSQVGFEIASRSTGVGQYDVLDVQTIGAQLGFSNLWTIHGFTIGVDWLTLNIPFYTVKSEAPVLTKIANGNDRGTIDDALKFMRYLPTGSVAKVSLGYSF